MADAPHSDETPESIRKMIRAEVADDIAEVRAKYLKHFSPKVEEFCSAMCTAYGAWRNLDNQISNKESAYISALVFSAIDSSIVSMRLLIEGHQIAAGAIYRLTLETIALAVLCSAPSLGILERFRAGEYSTNKAIRDLLRNTRRLDLSNEGVRAIEKVRDFFHQFSHPSKLSLATLNSFSGRGVYLGAAFDEGKLDAYTKEINARVSVAVLLSNIILGIQEGRRKKEAL